jgi:hypothetical protein
VSERRREKMKKARERVKKKRPDTGAVEPTTMEKKG